MALGGINMIRAAEIDLHLHSNISDGIQPDERLIDLVAKAGLKIAAVTDHDSMAAAHDPALAQHLRALGPNAPHLVPGVEISCWLESPIRPGCRQEVHVIGLGCNPYQPALQAALARQRLGIIQRIRTCVAKLNADGYPLRFADVGFAAALQGLQKWHIGKALAAHGYAKTPEEAVKNLVAPRYPKPERHTPTALLSPGEAVALIRAAGGVAILAHPHRNVPANDQAAAMELLKGLKEQGLDAVEVYRVDLPAAERPMYENVAQSVGLLLSGGTDYHGSGDIGGPRFPGDAHAPFALWPPLEALIQARGGVTSFQDVAPSAHPNGNAAERLLLTRAQARKRDSTP